MQARRITGGHVSPPLRFMEYFFNSSMQVLPYRFLKFDGAKGSAQCYAVCATATNGSSIILVPSVPSVFPFGFVGFGGFSILVVAIGYCVFHSGIVLVRRGGVAWICCGIDVWRCGIFE